MSIIEKVFKYEATELSVIKCKDEIWFRGKTIAEILGYTIQCKAILNHVDHEDKRKLSELVSKSKQNEMDPLKYRGSKTESLTNNQKNTIYINESGLYSLILRSKLESACAFKRWVTKEVLPSIRKTGRYSSTFVNDDMNHKYNGSLTYGSLTFKIENETDTHVKVVSFLKKRYPHSLFTATLGENQDSVNKWIDSFYKGYSKGSPDLIIHNLHKRYVGFCIEFNSPMGHGELSCHQKKMLQQYQRNGFKVIVSNDYDYIIETILLMSEYFADVRILCLHCQRKFITSQSLKNHIKSFHKMA